jgi:hypothetical protein
MEKIRNNATLSHTIKAIIPLIVFLVCMAKYYLFNVLQVYPLYGPQNRTASWLIILPLTLIGLYFTILNCISFFKNRSKENVILFLLSLPFIVYFVYFFFLK